MKCITINDKKIKIHKLIGSAKHIAIYNVCPFIPSQEILNALKDITIVPNSTINYLKAGLNETGYDHIMNLCDRGKFVTITHFFSIRGHSFLPCDGNFGSIKRLLRKTDRIYTLQQYAQLIIKASRCDSFSVHKVQID